MVKRNTQPEQVELDWGSFKGGSVDALVHWNITETAGATDDGTTYTQYEYEEARIRITASSTDVYAMICPVSGV